MPKARTKTVQVRAGTAGEVIGEMTFYVTNKTVTLESDIDSEVFNKIFGEELPGGVTLWRTDL